MGKAVLATLFVLALTFSWGVAIPSGSPHKGPRTEDLALLYYSSLDDAYAALKADEIDVLGYEITAELYEDAVLDPNIVLSGVADTGLIQFDLNNNHTIHSYPGVENPFWYAPVRRAVAWCTDKDYIANVICGGFAERIDAMIAAPSKGWANESYWYPNYPYEYDPAAAAVHLDAHGWTQGSTPNPNYDPEFPGSTAFLRVYPPEHSKAGQDVDPLRWVIHPADVRRFEAGQLAAEVFEKIGFQVSRYYPEPFAWWRLFVDKNWHLLTGGWDVGLFPTYLYTIYHSKFWSNDASTSNYITGNNQSNLPNYPEYDVLAEAVYYPTSVKDAVHAAKLATAFWTEQCINVPLFSSKSYWAHQGKLLGLVNMEGEGFENDYAFLNAYKADGTGIRYGLKSAPNSMNPQFADWYYSYQTLDRCFSYAGVSAPPYDPTAPQAGWLQDWDVGLWNDDGEYKTYMTHWVRSDSYFCEPVTGNRLSNVNASDYFFSIWYTYADPTAWRYSDVQDVHHIEIHNNYLWTVYFDAESYWFYLSTSPMLFPVDVWLREPLATRAVENFFSFTGPGIVALNGSPVWINEVTLEDAPLTFGTDYNIIRGKLEVLAALSGSLSVDYWKYGNAHGFTPGDLPWNETLVGSGMYYLTSFTPGVGGGATFKRNSYYWMETPPLGEIDFIWNFQDGPKPRAGFYDVDIYDVVIAADCFGYMACFIPSPKYISGVDLAPVGGVLNIYDIVTITGVYGVRWGHPP